MGPERFALDTIEVILSQLNAGQIERGWKAFVDRYSPLMFRIVREFENDDFTAEECFVDLCSALADNGFARLLQFRIGGAASFETWLSVVATRLCIDWQRARYGRLRPLKAVQDLDPVEQNLFDLRFRQGLALHECLLQLQQTFPGLTRESFNEHNGRLNRALVSRQHHALASNPRNPTRWTEKSNVCGETVQQSCGPESEFMREQDKESLGKALARLDPLQQLLIKLRFSHELTFEEVARMAGLKSAHSAHRRIRSALTELGQLMKN